MPSKALGAMTTLHLEILEARDLQPMDNNGKVTAYLALSLSPSHHLSRSSDYPLTPPLSLLSRSLSPFARRQVRPVRQGVGGGDQDHQDQNA